jgi:hypothetical protein
MSNLCDINIGVNGQGSEISKVGKNSFPDPWCDMASTQAPKSLRNVLDWSEFVWLTNGTYRMGCERVVSYFITNLNIDNTNDEVATKYKDYFTKRLKYVDILRLLGNDFQCYGNSFSSIFIPFERFLACRKCGLERPMTKVDFQWTKDFRFKATCPSCKWTGDFKRKDRKAPSTEDVRIIRWRPQDIKIQFNPITGDVEYRLKVDEEFTNLIKEGDEFLLRTTPWEFIETVKEGKLFKFAHDGIFHMKEECISGVKAKGWGIPRFISNFKQAYYIQVIKRFNEALALDYIVPFRVITPQPGSSKVADPLLHQDLSTNKTAVTGMIAEHRRDPASWHYLPFPMEYQTLGGEGMQMATYELINAATDEMLNAQGIPAELYRGSLTIQAAPMALRLFQQTWPHLVSNYNDWLTWAGHKIALFENWETADINLQPVTLADDIEKKQVLLQLASANIVSKRTALSPFGVDIDEETDRLFDEQQHQQDKEREFQREEAERAELEEQLAMAQQGPMPGGGGMGMPGGGAPMPGGGGMAAPSSGAVTPQGMMGQADQMAQQLIMIPYEVRRSKLQEIKDADPALHALVKQRMEDIRGEADSAGGQMLIEQQQQQMPPGTL